MCYCLAKSQMCRELMLLWKTCFDDTDEAVELFFRHWFSPENCAVCVQGGKVVSALYMLPAAVVRHGAGVSAHYIYAAATLPAFRARGYMGGLLAYANGQAAAKGQKYSVLLPAQASLYDYYRKQGYVNFFQTRFAALDRSTLKAYSEKGFLKENTPSVLPEKMYTVRTGELARLEGAVLWDTPAIAYAEAVNRLYGGGTVYCDNGYALYGRRQDSVEVTEIMADGQQGFYNLLAQLYRQVPAGDYRFRLPARSPYFAEEGPILPFGMIKPLAGADLPAPHLGEPPYLGLTLD